MYSSEGLTFYADGSRRSVWDSIRAMATLMTEVWVDGMKIEAVVDTGAEATIVSERYHQKVMGHLEKPEGPQMMIRNAKDASIMQASRIRARVRIGSFERDWTMLVAPIGENMLLGLDLLQEADLDIQAHGRVYVQGERIPSNITIRGMLQ